jgi:hypothetical protein
MSSFYQPRELGRARTLIAVAGLVLLSVALWFPRSSLLYGAGVLIGLTVLVGVRNSSSTMSIAWISLLTTACCVAGAFSISASKTLSLILSLVGIALAICLAGWHLSVLLKKRRQGDGQSAA